MRLQDNLEVELKLCVTGDNPDALLDEIASLDRIGSLRLANGAEHRLHDIYWDLPDLAMRAQHLSLRLRQIDDLQVFTAKGGTSNSNGLFRRYELEVPATRENWLAVRDALQQEGVSLGGDPDGDEPAAWLRDAGLQPTQDRSTHRTVRYAYSGDNLDRPLAELALDRTRFDFGKTLVDYWEIEIEELGGRGEEAPREIGLVLVERYPDRLEPSTMGKYSRGLTIERELRATGQL
jgi:inorganic triphosphatase YgiF